MTKSVWPAWYSSSDGETRIFNSPDEVPKGWTTGSEKQPVEKAAKPETAKKPADPFDHDGDGKPGGSKPKSARATKSAKDLDL